MGPRTALWARVAALTLVLAIALCVAGCAKPQESGATGGNATPAKPPTAGGAEKAAGGEAIKIGAIYGVTGPSAPLGVPEKAATELLVAQCNDAGGVLGRKVEVIIKDCKSDPQEAVIAAKDLIDNEKVVAILGTSDTATTMAIKDLCQEAQVPLVACAAGKAITDPLASYVFSVPQTNGLAARKLVAQALAAGAKTAAVLSVDNGFGKDGLANTEAAATEAGLELTEKQTFSPEDTDMTAQLTRIKAANPDVLLVWGTNPGPAVALKNAKTLGMTTPIYQSHGVANAKFLELAGDAAEGVQLPAGRMIVVDQIPDDSPQKELLTKFAADYKAKTGVAADTFAGHAWDAFHVVTKAIEKAGSAERDKIRDGIEGLGELVGTAGVFHYTATDHNGLDESAFVWVKVEGGAWKLAE